MATLIRRRAITVLIITILLVGGFGFAPIYMRLQDLLLLPNHAWIGIITDAALALAYTYALLYLCSLMYGWWRLVALCILFSASALANLTTANFALAIDTSLVGIALEASSAELSAFLAPGTLIYICLALAAAWVSHRLVQGLTPERDQTKKGFIFLAFMIAVLLGDNGGMGDQSVPFSVAKSTVTFVQERFAQPQVRDLSRLPVRWNKKPDALTIVLVIGESSRPDHWELNGYERETNPRLIKRKQVISLPHAISCTSLTRTAVPCLLTGFSVNDAQKSGLQLTPTQTSFIGVLCAQGFDTQWIGVQGAGSFIDSPFLSIMKEAKQHMLLSPHMFAPEQKDEAVLPLLDKFLGEPGNYKLAVVHTYGSHWPYIERYPAQFGIFKPECARDRSRYLDWTMVDTMKECDQAGGLINSYDNTILYTDYVLDEIITRLQSRRALMIYVSDHGESLGENGRYMHGSNKVPEQRQTAMLFWASPQFIAEQPQSWQRAHAQANEALTSEAIFHSVLDCAGMRADFIKPEFSLCSGNR